MNEVEHDLFTQLWLKVDDKICPKCEEKWDRVLYNVENKFGFTK